MHISVIIPLLNEKDSLEELHQRLKTILEQNNFNYEILFIDDGSTDDSWKVIQLIAKNHKKVKGIRFAKNHGKSQALDTAFREVVGDIVITMDADLQDFPEEIPQLYQMIKKGNYDIVSGWKENRKDNHITKNIPSKLFNWAARKTSGLPLHDFNCGLKAYKLEVVKQISLYADMHRYIPVLAKQKGFTNITEKKVKHAARKHGDSKYGTRRFMNGFLDLVTLSFLSKFGNKPMHFFGAFGVFVFLFGFFSALYIGLEKLFVIFYLNQSACLVTENPWFYIALICMILGTQLFLAGFLGEILVRIRPRHEERIQDTINLR